jgi:uncharacterized protein DUF4127
MSLLTAIVLACAAAQSPADRVLLVPIDSRPAAGQFAQMIGKMACAQVQVPPEEDLGRFTQPGNPDKVLDWLANADYEGVSSVVVSSDMIAYGGLIASRAFDTPTAVALARLRRLETIRKAHPDIPFYAFASIMRLAPTATQKSAAWRASLARYAELTDRYSKTKLPADFESLKHLIKMIPPGEIERYEHTRQRNHMLNGELIRMAARGSLDYVTLGQDDARQYGPHQPETAHLRQVVQGLGCDGKIFFCEGIDQLSNVLLSRALLKEVGWTPRVRVILSDPDRSVAYASYESKPISESLRDQIIASGARP